MCKYSDEQNLLGFFVYRWTFKIVTVSVNVLYFYRKHIVIVMHLS